MIFLHLSISLYNKVFKIMTWATYSNSVCPNFYNVSHISYQKRSVMSFTSIPSATATLVGKTYRMTRGSPSSMSPLKERWAEETSSRLRTSFLLADLRLVMDRCYEKYTYWQSFMALLSAASFMSLFSCWNKLWWLRSSSDVLHI